MVMVRACDVGEPEKVRREGGEVGKFSGALESSFLLKENTKSGFKNSIL